MSDIMTDKEYYSDKEYITNTMLGWAEVGPSYLHSQLALMGIEQEEPAYYIFGNAVHCKLLEEDEFPNRYYIISDKGPSNSTQSKFCDMVIAHSKITEKSLVAAYKLSYSTEKLKDDVILRRAEELYLKYKNYIDQKKQGEGKILLSSSDYTRIMTILSNVKSHKRANELLFNDDFTEVGNEKVIKFKATRFGDEEFNKLKSKLDRYRIDTINKVIMLIDVKTHSVKFENTNFRKSFSAAFKRLEYDRQFFTYSLALYDYFIKNYPNESIEEYTFEHKVIAIKSNYDHEVAVFDIPNEFEVSGQEKFKRAFENIRYYLQNPEEKLPYGANTLGEETLIYE